MGCKDEELSRLCHGEYKKLVSSIPSAASVCPAQKPFPDMSDELFKLLARDGLGAATTAFMNIPFAQTAHNVSIEEIADFLWSDPFRDPRPHHGDHRG
jgi:hypothetical protein